MSTSDDKELFESTRGKLLTLLCQGSRTVNELMDELGLTDNAVRAQLANLQLAGLVRQVGLRPGTRKPHVDYELTPKARQLFPGAYEPVLRTLVDVLRERMKPEEATNLMREAARRIFASCVGELQEQEPGRRAAELYEKLRAIAPGLMLEQGERQLELRACGCPLAAVTASHSEVCELLAAVLTELLGTEVRQRCQREETPRCCFELTKNRPDSSDRAHC
ncbi:MAG TPA: ArsR family transcriptional regulator [Tepidisphaeraceae bacterium]|nr:ArsR family transcriptional regulator [Tepidisphaeraceae bacterium]